MSLATSRSVAEAAVCVTRLAEGIGLLRHGVLELHADHRA